MIADETLLQTQGWKQFDKASNKKEDNQEHLDFAHAVASTFTSSQGQKVLKAMVSRYLLTDIVTSNDTQFGAGIKQGRASVVKYILSQIELSNNTK